MLPWLTRHAAALGVTVFAWAVAFWFAHGGSDFCLDDAWIHLAYARSLQLGQGLSYNPGDWETGSSSPLWVALLALLPLWSAPVASVKTLGIALHGVQALLAMQVATALARRDAGELRARWIGTACGVLVALHPALLQAATSGMEVGLTSALMLAMVGCLVGEVQSSRRLWLALGLSVLLALSRPEAVVFCVALGSTLALLGRRPSALAVAAGALAGLSLWVVYCTLVSGYPWPNTRYVKARRYDFEGLAYLAERVLAAEPWLIGIAGVVLIGLALHADAARMREGGARAGRGMALALFAAWLATCVGTAVSRPLSSDVLFYMSRYFAIVAAIPPVLVALGMARARSTLAAAGWALVVAASVVQLGPLRELVTLQERNIARLHTEPARYLARALPRDAHVIVEGAGASRFFAPRSMTMIDMLGLNDSAIAHAANDIKRACALYRAHPTHVLVPTPYLEPARALFDLRTMHRFDEPRYAQTERVGARSVFLMQVKGWSRKWAARCRRTEIDDSPPSPKSRSSSLSSSAKAPP